MSVLAELLLEALSGAIDLSSNRRMLAVFGALAGVLALATIWLLRTSSDPLNEPAWGMGLLLGSPLCGAIGSMIAGLHLRREPSDRLLGVVSLGGSLAAVLVPLLWLLGFLEP